MHFGAYSYTNTKVLFAVKCSGTLSHCRLAIGDWRWYRRENIKLSSFS